MYNKSIMQKKYFITTYGCQLNVHESEKLAGIMQELNYVMADKLEDANVIIFNTCAIRGGAEERAIGNISALKKFKQQNKNKIIAVCGCMTQQKSIADDMYKKFPFIDIIFGTNNIHLLKDFLERKNNQKRILEYSEDFNLDGEKCPIHRTSENNAWVNIMQGCNNFCSYCIVPYVRGRERSRPKDEILEEIKQIIKENKYEKITLLGQNVNSYGKDTLETNFAQLLQEICNLKDDFKLTFMTSNPKDLSSDIIEVIAKNDKILKEIHLPVQSGSNAILRKMNRKYTTEKYLSIINEIKIKIPNVRLTTDIIVGFPSETEEDFQMTCELIKAVQFDGVFAFMYSKRPGTPAAEMPEQIDLKTKKTRVNQVLKIAKEIKQAKKMKDNK
ncbi:MAG: tRNA (N6-isopentenyl adenosine(37)-C2)-methylthiotransferase MiaB [Clostridia bacterium]|nr:tRNA (N6-isopentenyl adenosine(37)-C2)-methylthiotransferase MiaB [Clostridia bacterium]